MSYKDADHPHRFECNGEDDCEWHSHVIPTTGFQSEIQQAEKHRRLKGHSTKEVNVK